VAAELCLDGMSTANRTTYGQHLVAFSCPSDNIASRELNDTLMAPRQYEVSCGSTAVTGEHPLLVGSRLSKVRQSMRIPVNVTAVSGNVTGDSGDRDRGAVLRVF